MRGLKIPLQDFALKVRGGGLMCEGGGVFAGHYGTCVLYTQIFLPFCHHVRSYCSDTNCKEKIGKLCKWHLINTSFAKHALCKRRD